MVFFVLLTGCANNVTSESIGFYDAYGKQYQSIFAPSDIRNEFGLSREPRIVIIATSTTANEKYLKQLSIVSRVDAEEFEYLYVVANTEEEDRSGYYVSVSESINILDGESFRVIVLDEKGEVLEKTSHVLSDNELKSHLTR
jgi:hypothetical protein